MGEYLGAHMNITEFDPMPWLEVRKVGIVAPGQLEFTAIPVIPLGVILAGTVHHPTRHDLPGVTIGVAAHPIYAAQIIDSLYASAEAEGTLDALTSWVDQARAARKAGP